MKRALAAVAIALSLFTGTVALADDHRRGGDRSHDRRHDDRRHDRGNDYRRDHDRRDYRHDNRRDHRYHDGRRYDGRRDYRDHRYDGRRDYRHDHRYDNRHHYRSPHYGYRPHHWRRGDRIPIGYFNSGYIVHDYHSHGLRHPGRGHHWVRVNNDVILAAITTGIVLDIAYNRY